MGCFPYNGLECPDGSEGSVECNCLKVEWISFVLFWGFCGIPMIIYECCTHEARREMLQAQIAAGQEGAAEQLSEMEDLHGCGACLSGGLWRWLAIRGVNRYYCLGSFCF